MRLPLLPIARIWAGFRAIRMMEIRFGVQVQFNSFRKYFLKFWMTGIKPENFCVSEARFRTNNHVERFNAKLSRRHPRFMFGSVSLI